MRRCHDPVIHKGDIMEEKNSPKDAKKDSEIIAEIYRNAQLALTSISDILPEIVDEEIREEIMNEHEEYERICGEAANLAAKYNLDLKEPGAMKKAMMWTAIKMDTAADNSANHIAEMMIKGTVTGITCLKTTLSESEQVMDDEVKKLLCDLIALEESFETRLKAYL